MPLQSSETAAQQEVWRRLESEWLLTYCNDEARSDSPAGFASRSVAVSDYDARNFLRNAVRSNSHFFDCIPRSSIGHPNSKCRRANGCRFSRRADCRRGPKLRPVILRRFSAIFLRVRLAVTTVRKSLARTPTGNGSGFNAPEPQFLGSWP